MDQVLQHKHLIIRAELNNPPKNTTYINDWLTNLVECINMKILMGPYSVYSDMEGNQGLTGVVIIETSHIAIHVWDEVQPALMQMDIYTCSELNIQDVFASIEVFEPTKVEYKFIDREHTLTLLNEHTI